MTDAAAIAEIYNEAIRNTTATLDTDENNIGTLREVGLKFGQRLDVHILQLML